MKISANLKWPCAAVVMLVTSGCLTVNELTVIKSDPENALVTINGYGECETPCSIEHNDIRDIIVAKAGYTPQRFRIAPGAGEINVILELAAPTEGVEENTLPEL